MHQGYVLEWLDSFITISLNPIKTDLNTAVEIEQKEIRKKIEAEKSKLLTFLKETVFSLENETKIRAMVKKYHSGLILLLNQALENRRKYPKRLSELKLLTDDVVSSLEEMISFVEQRFSIYLNSDDPVPATYCDAVFKEVMGKSDKIKKELIEKKYNRQLLKAVFPVIRFFLEKMFREHSMAFRDVLYLKEICNELEHLDHSRATAGVYTPLDELLIHMNFNDKTYTDLLITRIIRESKKCKSIPDKLDVLLLNFKALKQIPKKPNTIFKLDCGSIHDMLRNWFAQEIAYVREKQHLSTESGPETGAAQPVREKKLKILCTLSTDQIGIILRAADELRVLKARSLNEVFRIMVPYLSTPHKKDLSYDAMRSKSYVAETRDKDIAIKTLEKIIETINTY